MKPLLTCVLLLFFVSCGFLDLTKGEKFTEVIMLSLKKGDWNTIRENSSLTYRKKISDDKFNDLKKWVNYEFGKFKSYKKNLLYSGSSFTVPGENFITATYQIQCAKGYGEIEMVIIKEEGKYKLYALDFSKKP